MKFIPRELEGSMEPFLRRREIVGIFGPRQAGKTTLMKMIYRRLAGNKAFVSMDLPEEREAIRRDPLSFVRRHLPSLRGFLFLDEIQRVERFGEKLKIIYDMCPQVKMVVSGSSSPMLRRGAVEFLVGRLISFVLYPFSFYEYLLVVDPGLAGIHRSLRDSFFRSVTEGGKLEEPVYGGELSQRLGDYFVYGGYPSVVFAEQEEVKRKVLADLVSLYLERDVISYFGVENEEGFLNFARMLARAMGSIISVSSMASSLKMAHKTAQRYLEILEKTYLVERVPPYHTNVATELRKSKKVYFTDLGVRNYLLGNFLPPESRTDLGQLLEGFVFRELRANLPGTGIYYWRTTRGAEVDFVVEVEGEPVPVEVKSGPRLSRGFYSFLRKYGPSRAYVITLSQWDAKTIGGTKVFWVPAWFL